MENQIYKLTSGLIRMKPLTLFLVTTLPLLFKFSMPATEAYVFINKLMMSIGSIILFAWVYAVGCKSNDKLLSEGISVDIFKYFNWVAALSILFYILTMFATTEVITNKSGMQFRFATPVYLPIICMLAFIATLLIAAKMLVSAEQNKEAKFDDYCNTFLLFMIASIGLWFIQPRVQKL